MRFQSISLTNWRQFGDVDIQFDKQLTILTGANGSGKTTILNLLGRHYNWNVHFMGVPIRSSTGVVRYWADLKFMRRGAEESVNIGKIVYSTGAETPIQTSTVSGAQYSPQIPQMQSVPGIFVPSHRPLYSYQPVQSIPVQPVNRSTVYTEYSNIIFSRYSGQHTVKSPIQTMKETLISMAVFSVPGPNIIHDTVAGQLFAGFQEILLLLLPPEIGFKKLVIQTPEVLLETSTGTFPVDAASGGLSSLIDIAWRIFMFEPTGNEFVCSIDEPENHLHPAMQQSFLPNLLRAFPNVQFVVATHSPFMITALPQSAVYVLDFDPQRSVVSQKLDLVDRSGTADVTLREVLGLPFTMPLWAERKLDEIIGRHINEGITEETGDMLEAELCEAGLERYTSKAVQRLLEELPDEQ